LSQSAVLIINPNIKEYRWQVFFFIILTDCLQSVMLIQSNSPEKREKPVLCIITAEIVANAKWILVEKTGRV
jgi:hypothetical protein